MFLAQLHSGRIFVNMRAFGGLWGFSKVLTWPILSFKCRRFSADSIKEVRRLIALETTEGKRDSPFVYLMDVLHKTAFKGSPLGQTSVIPAYNMNYVDSAKLFDRWDAHYGFANIGVVATNLGHGEVLNALTSSPWLARYGHS